MPCYYSWKTEKTIQILFLSKETIDTLQCKGQVFSQWHDRQTFYRFDIDSSQERALLPWLVLTANWMQWSKS